MNQKLSDHDRDLIRELAEEREKHRRIIRELSNRKLAEKFGVHFQTIKTVLRG